MVADGLAEPHWFFTAPYEAPMVRRGDPLGLRLAAGRYAEVLAPGLSNRTIDARWLTLTAWTLVMANDVWRRRGNSAPSGLSRNAAREIFEWIEPLELLWVARTLTLADRKGRQLPGQRAVRRWLDAEQRPARFGMSRAQYQRTRFIGVYGGYRAALRGLDGMTVDGDGWRPGPVAEALARIAQGALGAAAATPAKPHGKFTAEHYWQKEGWEAWQSRAGRDFLPESLEDIRPVSSGEIGVLRPLLFGNQVSTDAARLRHRVVEVMDASNSRAHHELCHELERKLGRATQGALDRLGSFARLADAGVGMMNAIWLQLGEAEARKVPALRPREFAENEDARDRIREFVDATKAWQREKSAFRPEWTLAHELAALARDHERDSAGLVRRLVEYHCKNAGGRRWFRVDEEGLVRPASTLRDQEGSPYRYRLFSLARLAMQCKVIDRIPKALEPEDDEEGQE
jgi:hypothetical protein